MIVPNKYIIKYIITVYPSNGAFFCRLLHFSFIITNFYRHIKVLCMIQILNMFVRETYIIN